MKTAILNRYGFAYIPSTDVNPYPEPQPFYTGDRNGCAVREHAKYCLDRMIYPQYTRALKMRLARWAKNNPR